MGAPGSQGNVFHGHFLTSHEVSRLLRVAEDAVADLAGLVRLGGPLGETYPAVQFTPDGHLVEAIVRTVEYLATSYPGESLAAWLTAPQPGLANRTPAAWLREGRAVERALRTAPPAARNAA